MSLIWVLSALLLFTSATLDDVVVDIKDAVTTEDDMTVAAKETVAKETVAKETDENSSPEVGKFEVVELRMPSITTTTHDVYLVTPVKVEYDDAYIVGYKPKVGLLTF